MFDDNCYDSWKLIKKKNKKKKYHKGVSKSNRNMVETSKIVILRKTIIICIM